MLVIAGSNECYSKGLAPEGLATTIMVIRDVIIYVSRTNMSKTIDQ